MPKKKLKIRQGFTLVEMAMVILLAAIVMSGVGVIIADSQRGWSVMYNRIYSDIVNDSYVARRAFDAVIRKASREKFSLDPAGTWLEVYYYADSDSTALDRYAHFYCSTSQGSTTSQLNVEHGILDPKETLFTQTICTNVSSCVFKQAGKSAQMVLTLSDGAQTFPVISAAVMHN